MQHSQTAKFLELKKIFMYIYDSSEFFLFYEHFSVSIQKTEHWENLGSVRLAVLTLTAEIKIFRFQKSF